MVHAILLGALLTATSSLGYARPGYGVELVMPEQKALRGELFVLSVEKRDGGSGYSLGGYVELGILKVKKFRLYAGGDAVSQRVERYSSQRASPRVEAIVSPSSKVDFSAYWVGKGQKVERVVGISMMTHGKTSLKFSVESVKHTLGFGKRVETALLWRIR